MSFLHHLKAGEFVHLAMGQIGGLACILVFWGLFVVKNIFWNLGKLKRQLDIIDFTVFYSAGVVFFRIVEVKKNAILFWRKCMQI